MRPDYFDNRARIVKDDLVAQIGTGDRLSVAASVFSMYAYRELAEQLEGLDEFELVCFPGGEAMLALPQAGLSVLSTSYD